MKGDGDDLIVRDELRIFRTGNVSQGKINTLLADLLEKEEEIRVYKNRLKELEEAFYYNLELISERDLELGTLEKQLAAENEQLEKVVRERNELEDLIKTIDEKNNRKIKQLEKKLTLKEEEVKDLQRENLSNISALKGIIDDVKQQEEKKLYKMSTKFETHKNELIKSYREEIDQREKYYLLEIDNLTRKLDQACREKDKLAYAEEEIKKLKCHLEEVEKLFLEKENRYLEEIRKISKSYLRKVNKEVQCAYNPQRIEKIIQAEPDITVSDSQTSHQEIPQQEELYKQKISFLQEQNEVLKFIIKDLKRNRDGGGQPPGCECLSMRADIEKVSKKFESEISNLKKILEKELKERAEEDAVIQTLEASVTCLKDKLLLGLQEKLHQFSGDDICSYVYNREIYNEIQVTLLEQKLSQKIDSLRMTAEEQRQKLHEKLDELKKECFDKMDKYLKSKEEPEESKTENIIQKIREEMQKFQNKIHSDVRSVLGNNCDINKGCKNMLAWGDYQEVQHRNVFPPGRLNCWRQDDILTRPSRKRLGEETELGEFTNNLMAGR